MSLSVDGRIHSIGEVEQKTASFQAREFVLEIPDGQYPQLAKFQLVQERVGLIDAHDVGDTVTVYFDIRGREWNGKVLTNLNAWKIVGGGSPEERKVPAVDETLPNNYAFPGNGSPKDDKPDGSSDLPF